MPAKSTFIYTALSADSKLYVVDNILLYSLVSLNL